MSTQPIQYLFVVWAPDYPDGLPRRLEVRAKHLEGMKAHVESGGLVLGGAMVDEDSLLPSVTAKKMEGSVMIFKAARLEEVKSIIESDIYWTSNVWDKENLQIKPFLAAGQPTILQ
ncbi:hypothetical protein EWM64_g9987 [Hericium alpestre]|uniref:YCII-related domain-containing protein n=1 Tax=Hericium alpestre TaxID=135208 RepID=A0A4Y9ZJ10_9AGAM|nr:hypothetical protein EWM64_g9987 [Hericium alpestre]